MSSLVGAGSMLLGSELPPLRRVNIPAMAQLWTVETFPMMHSAHYDVCRVTHRSVAQLRSVNHMQ